MFGKVNVQIKLVEGDSAGTVTAFYVCHVPQTHYHRFLLYIACENIFYHLMQQFDFSQSTLFLFFVFNLHIPLNCSAITTWATHFHHLCYYSCIINPMGFWSPLSGFVNLVTDVNDENHF